MRKKKSGTYKVGYGKPPQGTQFKKGQSGNPKGRPRRSKNVATVAQDALFALVKVNENGRRRRVSKIEVGFTQLANRIAKGDLAAIRLLLTIPGVQKDLVEFRSSRPLTPEAWERVVSLVRGDLNPEDEGKKGPKGRRRQPDISEVASRLKGALKNRR
ncbi:MAG: DUF5681 domain-containing protein [Candidatus Binatus sp.]|uniref:DUF5681 domain-containing protein n=1 Tax=Candidatus Binatus sp. TaxID=2811406 RepID=UPI0027289C3B|nr:DUF5681 domain-containing protein [Candidatus Binatus sp.]MDO8431322.1 DUF5681 domain-containing protein [Candidatus Binatus sp.]